jgi:hypothetical protein
MKGEMGKWVVSPDSSAVPVMEARRRRRQGLCMVGRVTYEWQSRALLIARDSVCLLLERMYTAALTKSEPKMEDA